MNNNRKQFARDISGENMRKKTGLSFTKIIFCFILLTILFAFQSCSRDRSIDEKPGSLGISAIDHDPSWSPDGTRIVFFSHRDNNKEIYVMNADGSNQIRLTHNLSLDGAPSWSPDGKKIVFDSDRDGNFEIYVMNADGSNQKRLTDNPTDDNYPSWSPDGTRIAFHSNRDGNMDIYTLRVDSLDQTRLTENPAPDALPSWSPDGQKIAFLSARDGNNEIYTMNADGSDQTRLTDNPTLDLYPAWSPDSRKISFNSTRNNDEGLKIYTMNADGSEQTRLTDEPFYEMFSSWSPDGTRIVFTSGRDFDMEVYVVDADGSKPINLTNNAPANEAFGSAPLPRSEMDLDEIPYRIVFESYRETDGKENWEICLIDADGSEFVNLTNTPEIDEMYPHASPDGSQICFVAIEGTELENKSRNVYYINIDGTDRVKIAENAYQPCWSPDGRYLAYLPGEYHRYSPDVSANMGLEIYNLETGEVKRHPNDEIINLSRLCWSPDGKWLVAGGIAFKADDKTMMDLSIPGCTPDISSDGKKLAWNGTDYTLNTGKLNFGSPERNVTDHRIVVACERDHWIYHSDWSPDSNYLAFSYAPMSANSNTGQKAPGSNICICDLRTGKWTQITTDGKHNKEPDWVPVQVR
jgi:Tol biopolymer transport system component